MSLDNDSKKWLTNLFGDSVKFDESMSRHTSLHVGGPADAYVTPERLENLAMLVKWARQRELPYLVIGDGTNLLVKDNGITGIVIVVTKCLKTITQSDIAKDTVTVKAMAGSRMRSLCSFALERGFGGMNFAFGIPGTVGGGIMMNAGSAYGSVESVLDSIKVLLPTGQTKKISRDKLNFSYRKLSWGKEMDEIRKGQPIILEGCFSLYPSDPQKLKEDATTILKTRKKTQPIGSFSAGCFFKNPLSGKTAGELIELAGLKGKKIGGAEVSSKHANFIINTGKASAADILALSEIVQEKVSKMFNIDLQKEVKIVGT